MFAKTFIYMGTISCSNIVVFIGCNLPFPYLQISIYALLFIIYNIFLNLKLNNIEFDV